MKENMTQKQPAENRPEIEKIMTLNLTHVQEQNGWQLGTFEEDGNPFFAVYAKKDRGWFLYPDKRLDPDAACSTPLKNAWLPDDIADVIRYTKQMGCSIICLDVNGPVIPDLPVYKWKRTFP